MKDFRIIPPDNTVDTNDASQESEVEAQEEQVVSDQNTETSNEETPVSQVEETPVFDINSVIKEKTEGKFEDLDSMLDQLGKTPYKDDYIKNVVEHYEKTGSLDEYLQIKSTDWDELPSEDIARMAIEEQYPNASKDIIDLIFQKEVTEKYALDPEMFDENDVKVGKVKLDQFVSKIREQKKQEQEKFKAPDPVDIQEKMKAEIAEWVDVVENSDDMKSLMESKRVAFKTEYGEFNYDLENPDDIKTATIDQSKFFEKFSEKGQVNWNKWIKINAMAQNPEAFINALIGFGKEIGKGAIVDDMSNKTSVTNPVGSGSAPTGPKSLAEAFLSKS